MKHKHTSIVFYPYRSKCTGISRNMVFKIEWYTNITSSSLSFVVVSEVKRRTLIYINKNYYTSSSRTTDVISYPRENLQVFHYINNLNCFVIIAILKLGYLAPG